MTAQSSGFGSVPKVQAEKYSFTYKKLHKKFRTTLKSRLKSKTKSALRENTDLVKYNIIFIARMGVTFPIHE